MDLTRKTMHRVRVNLSRILNLLAFAEVVKCRIAEAEIQFYNEIIDDIKRVSVVLIHATLEDFLRDLLHEKNETFNSSKQIALSLKKANITYAGKYLKDIDAMLKRRHQIVHRADLQFISGKHIAYSTVDIDLIKWTEAVILFISEILNIVGSQKFKELFENSPEFGFIKSIYT